jgi:ferredoxin
MKELKTYQQIWFKLAASISDGLTMKGALPTSVNNMLGRSVSMDDSGNLAVASGMSATGLRATAWLEEKHFSENLHTLKQAVRNLQPLVAITRPGNAKPLAGTGAFVLFASNPQELIDFTLIAHYASELALIPGIVIFHFEDQEADLRSALLPDIQNVLSYLGDPEERIPSPTAAQKILFGNTRRRIPRPFNSDVPVLSGATKSAKGIAYESAAHQAYLSSHVGPFIEQAFNAFEKIFGRRHEPFLARHTQKAQVLLCCTNEAVFESCQGWGGHAQPGTILLKQLVPFPEKLRALPIKANAYAVAEQVAEGGSLLFSTVLEAMAQHSVTVYSGLFAEMPSIESLKEFILRIETKKMDSGSLWLDVPFYHNESVLPKQQVLMQDIQRAYPQLKNQTATPKKSSIGSETNDSVRIPFALRKYKDHGPVYSRLANFFDNTAFTFDTDNKEWISDPFQAMPVMPPAVAGFGQATAKRSNVPVLHSSSCTGCGNCFIHCPHSALPPLVLDMEGILKSGILQAQAKGNQITQLIPHLKSVVRFANQAIEARLSESKNSIPSPSLDASNADIQDLSSFLQPAIRDFLIQSKLDGEKLQLVTAELNLILETIGAFQVVANDTFFNDHQKNLFSLSMDPNACIGCGICAAVCPEEAIEMKFETPALKDKNIVQFGIWEHMTDTSGETIRQLIENPEYPSLAALLLSRNFYMSLTGGGLQNGASARTMIHMVTAVAEAMVQKKYSLLVQQIDEHLERLAINLKKQLSDALPDLSDNGLIASLESMHESNITMEELLERHAHHGHRKLMDKAVLLRKIDVSKELNNLKELIVSGPGGVGRARYGIIMDASLSELATYPLNCFTVPVFCFEGSTFEMAQGLIAGHLRHLLDNIKVLRRTALEASNSYNPALHDQEIAAITWSDLNEIEKSCVPPLLLIGRNELLQNQGTQALAELLKDDLPLKVILLDDSPFATSHIGRDIGYDHAALLPFMAMHHVQLLQGSLAQPEHLAEGLISGLGKSGPVIARLLAPESDQINKQMLHDLACNCRAFIHFDYRPDREGSMVLSKLHIDVNPFPDDEWVTHTFSAEETGGQGPLNYELTPADWIYAQTNGKTFFKQWHGPLDNTIQVAEYVRLNIADRHGKIPVIMRRQPEGGLVWYVVADPIIQLTEKSRVAWHFMREIAGTLTAFPEKLYARATQELSIKYEVEKQQLVADYTERIHSMEKDQLEKMRTQLKSKLLQMATTPSPK